MIKHVKGNLIVADAEALVNTVNTVGIMGKGIALQFRQAFPANYEAYRKACAKDEVQPGHMFVYRTGTLTNPQYIINFPTKRHWRGKTIIEDIELGLADLIRVIKKYNISSIALPPLGCGNGGLDWNVVRPLIMSAFAQTPETELLLYGPAGSPNAENMKIATKPPKMTLARAAIILLMDKYTVPGYRMSLLEIQKLAYLLQEAGQPLKLLFAKNRYGPYAENLQHALQHMEGHYIRGYGDRSQSSRAASITLIGNAMEESEHYLRAHPATLQSINKVSQLIEGFESPYGLELIATVHFLAKQNPDTIKNVDLAINGVKHWNEHKRKTFEPKHIAAAWNQLHDQGWL